MNKKIKYKSSFIKLILLTMILLCTASCTHKGTLQIDPKAIYDTSLGFNMSDLFQTTDYMVNAMLEDKVFNTTPIITVGYIENNTDEHIDTKMLMNFIRTIIIKSKKAKFTINATRALQTPTSNSQKRQIVPQYILDGTITTIKQHSTHQINHFYKLILQLHEIKTGLVVWIEQKEFSKIYEK